MAFDNTKENGDLPCARCRRTAADFGSDLKQCGRCRSTWYCSRECQKADWRSHQRDCNTVNNRLDIDGARPAATNTESVQRGVDSPPQLPLASSTLTDDPNDSDSEPTDQILEPLRYWSTSEDAETSARNEARIRGMLATGEEEARPRRIITINDHQIEVGPGWEPEDIPWPLIPRMAAARASTSSESTPSIHIADAYTAQRLQLEELAERLLKAAKARINAEHGSRQNGNVEPALDDKDKGGSEDLDATGRVPKIEKCDVQSAINEILAEAKADIAALVESNMRSATPEPVLTRQQQIAQFESSLTPEQRAELEHFERDQKRQKSVEDVNAREREGIAQQTPRQSVSGPYRIIVPQQETFNMPIARPRPPPPTEEPEAGTPGEAIAEVERTPTTSRSVSSASSQEAEVTEVGAVPTHHDAVSSEDGLQAEIDNIAREPVHHIDIVTDRMGESTNMPQLETAQAPAHPRGDQAKVVSSTGYAQKRTRENPNMDGVKIGVAIRRPRLTGVKSLDDINTMMWERECLEEGDPMEPHMETMDMCDRLGLEGGVLYKGQWFLWQAGLPRELVWE